jgi:DNA modification methylase
LGERSIAQYVTPREASEWASHYLGRIVTPENISYLIQYAKIHTFDQDGNLKIGGHGDVMISLQELRQYYGRSWKEEKWKEILGKDINWNLSFDNLRESERTKHVHRLHPYKGKFIPQLAEYFLDRHVNDFKKTVFFDEGDIILDPFVGSGTTLVQCLETGLHSIGVDISKFNCMITEVKIRKYDLKKLTEALCRAARATEKFSQDRFWHESGNHIDELLSSLNERYYPNPQYKFLIRAMREFEDRIAEEINEIPPDPNERHRIFEETLIRHKDETVMLEKQIETFVAESSDQHADHLQFRLTADNMDNLVGNFEKAYSNIVLKEISEKMPRHKQSKLDIASSNPFPKAAFLSMWFTERQREEMHYYLEQIKKEPDPDIQDVMRIVLSRTGRSCRATTHIDLATLIRPQSQPYYCGKHFKICRPVNTIVRHLKRYTEDTLSRIEEFGNLRKDVFSEVLNDDSRTLNILDSMAAKNAEFCRILERKGIDGIFTSPPYVGQIDYHEQHAYAYELFNIGRKDESEIGKQSDGTGRKAQDAYIAGISTVLQNVNKYLKKDAHIFIVANDNKNLYPEIAKRSGLDIADVFKRPVLNRTERDKQPYSEAIFHMVF